MNDSTSTKRVWISQLGRTGKPSGSRLWIVLVAMLTRMIEPMSDQVRENEGVYGNGYEYGYGYGCEETDVLNKPSRVIGSAFGDYALYCL